MYSMKRKKSAAIGAFRLPCYGVACASTFISALRTCRPCWRDWGREDECEHCRWFAVHSRHGYAIIVELPNVQYEPNSDFIRCCLKQSIVASKHRPCLIRLYGSTPEAAESAPGTSPMPNQEDGAPRRRRQLLGGHAPKVIMCRFQHFVSEMSVVFGRLAAASVGGSASSRFCSRTSTPGRRCGRRFLPAKCAPLGGVA